MLPVPSAPGSAYRTVLDAASGGFVGSARQVWATMRVEIVMQWRRWGLWAAFGGVAGLLVLLTLETAIYLKNLPADSIYVLQHYTLPDLENLLVYGTTAYGAVLFGLVAALLVVDRMERDRRMGMFELQRATPQTYGRYLLGKFLGNYMAVVVPALAGYIFFALITLLLGWSPVLLSKFLLAFALIFVPASLAAVALTLLLASFLPVRIVQIGFSLLWFEFYLGVGWHGLAASIFNIGGFYIYPVFFPTPPPLLSVMTVEVSLQLALLNIAALLLTALVSLFLTYATQAFRQHRAERA